MDRKGTPASPAVAFARSVLPVPTLSKEIIRRRLFLRILSELADDHKSAVYQIVTSMLLNKLSMLFDVLCTQLPYFESSLFHTLPTCR